MTASTPLLGLTGLLLPLSWLGESGMTYTVQHSADLHSWESLPMVFTGTGEALSLLLDLPGSPVFGRLRYSGDGDTNGNGIPDQWEWEHFGQLDIDPTDDPDEDTLSNYAEWLGQTDPTDYFNGETPVLQMACGAEWLIPEGSVSFQAISLSLRRANGDPWAEAPVWIRFQNGRPGLVDAQDPGSSPFKEIRLFTDSLGRIDPGVEALHVMGHPQANTREVLEVRAGPAVQGLVIHTVGTDHGPPPRRFTHLEQADGGMVFSWAGPPGAASAFIIEEKSQTGAWLPVLELAAGELPDPDPETHLYTCILEAPAGP